MDFKPSTGKWIFAYHSSGGPKNSNDQSASISQHDNQGPFEWSWANGKGGNSANPFTAAPAGTGTGAVTATSCVPRPTSGAAAVSGTSTRAATTQSDDGDDDDRSTRRDRPTEFPTDVRSRFPTPTANANNSEYPNIDIGTVTD